MDDSDRNCKRHHQKSWMVKTINGATVRICRRPGCNRVWGGNPDLKLVRIYT